MALQCPAVCALLVEYCPLSPGAGFTHVREVCASMNRAWTRMKMKICRYFLDEAITSLMNDVDNRRGEPHNGAEALMALVDLRDIL